LAKSPKKAADSKTLGAVRMTISGSYAEMKKIKDEAAARNMPNARYIHEAVANYAKDGTPASILSDEKKGQKEQDQVNHTLLWEIENLLIKHTSKERNKASPELDLESGHIETRLDQLQQSIDVLSKAIGRELPRRDNEAENPRSVFSLPALEAMLVAAEMLIDLSQTSKSETSLDKAMKRTIK
jgi:hypothetical protein